MEQAALVPLERAGVLHWMPDRSAAGGRTVSDAALVIPPRVARTFPDCSAATTTVEAVKFALTAPAGTMIVAGTLIAEAPLANVTVVAAGGGLARVTVHVADAGAVTNAGEHVKPESEIAGGVPMLTSWGTDVTGTADPVADTAVIPFTPMVKAVEEVKLRTARAMTPEAIGVEFSPTTRHVCLPETGAHVRVLPAPATTGPG
jgi:hypothetical protein